MLVDPACCPKGIWAATALFLLLVCCGLPVLAEEPGREPLPISTEEQKPESLPIHLTDEEKQRLHEIGRGHRVTAAPPGTVRNPAEWEPSEGVLIRWPLGISLSLVAEMSEDVVVTTIVANSTEESNARTAYAGAGVNMSNLDFIQAPTNSIWTRDYGPWFIFEDGNLAISDPVYNRPRPDDDVIPQVVGSEWGLPVYGMDLIHTGGNHMSNGLGTSMSTELTYDENPDKTEAEVDQIMLDYLGNDFVVLDYIQSSGIHHIDCWAKFLGPSTIMVKDVSPGDSTYDELNARAEFLSQQMSPWGEPYTVHRIFCPSGTYYTNSLILNGKVLVPLFGDSEDSIALQTYRDAMPGYEVLGFTGSWTTEDALHCRTMGVPDRGMLYIDHVPFHSEDITYGDYDITATITAASGQPLLPDELTVNYSVDGGLWQSVPLTEAPGPDAYIGLIPAQAEDSVISYYLRAADESGRVETHPYIGEPWAHSFTAICPNHPLIDVAPDGNLAVCSGSGQTLTASLSGGAGPFSYQWTEDGADIPGATSDTFVASGSGSHLYNCKVWGDGCVNPRTDLEDVSLTWQTEPVFEGVQAVGSPQYSSCTLDLSWDAATPACGGPVYYNVYRSITPGFTPGPENLLVAALPGTTFSDMDDLAFNTTYNYIVRAEDASNGSEDANLVELAGAPAGPGSGGTRDLFTDDFEDAGSWADWTVTTGPGTHTCGDWARASSSSQRPPNSSGYYALTDSDACGSGSYTSTDLISPGIDCSASDVVSVTLEYDLYYRNYNGDDASVEVYDGADWHVVWTDPDSSVQARHSWDVTEFAAGNPDFQVRFNYQNASYDYWFAVDNVSLTGGIGNACATGSSVSTVPDGSEGGTVPLLAAKSGADIALTWDVATGSCVSPDYHLIWGWGADVATAALSGSDCALSSSGSHLWSDAPDTASDWAWFLVVGSDGSGIEGGWGTDSGSHQRSSAASGECGTMALDIGACLP
jgi:agmatine/peptidylarginine deiminase